MDITEHINALIKATKTIEKQWLPHINRIVDASNAKSKELLKVMKEPKEEVISSNKRK